RASSIEHPASSIQHRASSTEHRVLRAVAVGLAACGLASCGRPRAAAWEPQEFLIALRGAPPRKADPYAQAAAAGFAVMGQSTTLDALGLARRYGLRLMVDRIGLHPETIGRAASRRRAAEALGRFGGHPALWGYFVAGQVREGQLDEYARLAAFVREHDPSRPFLVTLLPCEAWVGPALATADYRAYLERVIAAVRPPLLVLAHHPFRAAGRSRFYFESLELVREAAVAHGLPWCTTVRGALWRGMPALSEGQMRWLVYTALAYGAKGVVWFGYWGAPDGGPEGIVRPDGTPTERYRWVRELNRELRAVGPHLLPLRSRAVYHTGTVPSGARRLPVHGLVGSVEGGDYVVGVLEDQRGRPHLLVVNKDAESEVVARLSVNRPCRPLWWLDPSQGEWLEAGARVDRFHTVVEFPLPPGGGRLIRLPAASP
ncbi:MAG: hypothetical protein ACLF0G_16275, partial [Candidatus Brocadiia bacterium]